MSARDRSADEGTMERLGRSMGEAAGKAADMAAGMAAEVAAPLLRSAADVLGGWWAEDSARTAASSWDETEDRRWREHHSRTGGGAPYEQVRPYYQLGHTAAQNPEYDSREFEDVEADLRRIWAEGEAGGSEEWPNARAYMEFGYGGGDR